MNELVAMFHYFHRYLSRHRIKKDSLEVTIEMNLEEIEQLKRSLKVEWDRPNYGPFPRPLNLEEMTIMGIKVKLKSRQRTFTPRDMGEQ